MLFRSAPPSSNQESTDYVGETAAKNAALTHAGVSSSDAVWIKAQFERDDGRYVYELEFTANGTKYEYKVDAASGEVVKYESETFNAGNGGTQTGTGSVIGEAAAKAAALSHAGVSEADASRMRVELDRDDGYVLYEIEFREIGRASCRERVCLYV